MAGGHGRLCDSSPDGTWNSGSLRSSLIILPVNILVDRNMPLYRQGRVYLNSVYPDIGQESIDMVVHNNYIFIFILCNVRCVWGRCKICAGAGDKAMWSLYSN